VALIFKQKFQLKDLYIFKGANPFCGHYICNMLHKCLM